MVRRHVLSMGAKHCKYLDEEGIKSYDKDLTQVFMYKIKKKF